MPPHAWCCLSREFSLKAVFYMMDLQKNMELNVWGIRHKDRGSGWQQEFNQQQIFICMHWFDSFLKCIIHYVVMIKDEYSMLCIFLFEGGSSVELETAKQKKLWFHSHLEQSYLLSALQRPLIQPIRQKRNVCTSRPMCKLRRWLSLTLPFKSSGRPFELSCQRLEKFNLTEGQGATWSLVTGEPSCLLRIGNFR